MKKEQVGMIEFLVQIRGEDALHVKLYRDGTILREGGGGLPPVGVAGQYRDPGNNLFAQMLAVIPQPMLDQPLVYEADNPATPVDYRIFCHGGNENGGIGEAAVWSATRGIRVLFDLNEPPKSALLPLADRMIGMAKVMTNSFYFDVMVEAVFRHHSTALPKDLLIDVIDDSEDWLQKAMMRYVVQMTTLSAKSKLEDLTKGKTYLDSSGIPQLLTFMLREGRISYRFVPA